VVQEAADALQTKEQGGKTKKVVGQALQETEAWSQMRHSARIINSLRIVGKKYTNWLITCK
jgi:hypothetical protein